MLMIFIIFLFSTLLLTISTLVMSLSSILSKKKINDRNKLTPFECGFNPLNSSRFPFSIRFFLIAIIFLIFDVEIALIIPMIISLNNSNMKIWLLTNLSFIFILLIGLFHEWKQGSLNWSF